MLSLLLVALPPVARAGPGEEQLFTALQGRCAPRQGLLVSPRQPTPREPLRVLVVEAEAHPGARLLGVGPNGRHSLSVLQGGGPPYWWMAQLAQPVPGNHRFALVEAGGRVLACGNVRVASRASAPEESASGEWPIERAWNRTSEAFYSAWIELLFAAPARTQPGWSPLHEVLRDPTRNVLYNHLGSNEDGPDPKRAVVVEPDCADLPYFLRAYFAWKLRLPFGWRHCDRGNARQASRCGELISNLSVRAPGGTHLAERFSRFLRAHVSLVHSASGRTAADDEETDLYPVALSRATLPPGTVYVDPYGHLLVVAKWVEQGAKEGGLLYAIDGHPDLSVGRKRFWKGAFLFSDRVNGGGGGFKAFRPLVLRGGELHPLTNAELSRGPQYRNYSAEQYRLGIEGFYDRMDELINPRPLPPLQAYRERLEALYELVLERVGSVQAGEEHMAKTRYAAIAMPRGPKIFETQGVWEDFSTPARDMRLLIAIEEIERYPQKVIKQPQRFALGPSEQPAAAEQQMQELRRRFTEEKRFTYRKSDGGEQSLTLAELLRRRRGLEMAYNPNDCVELRWAAAGAELASCRRHAPEEQQRRMEQYRIWFASRERPPAR